MIIDIDIRYASIYDIYSACSVTQSLSHVWLFATSWVVALWALLSMKFSRQEYWSGLPFPIPGDLPHPGIESVSPMSSALAGRFFTTQPPGKTLYMRYAHIYASIYLQLMRTLTIILRRVFLVLAWKAFWFLFPYSTAEENFI